jgi:electron transfer flavoprotein alpha subunit
MILALVEHDNGRLDGLAPQMLTFARRLAAELDVPLDAAVIGAEAAELAGELGAYGVSTVHVVENERLSDYNPVATGQCAVELVHALRPEAVVAAGNDRGHEVMAHLAASLDLPLAANCIEAHRTDGPDAPLELTRFRWAGTLLEEATLTSAVKLLTVAPHTIVPEESPVKEEPEVVAFTPALEGLDTRVRMVDRVEPDRSKISLADAKVVVGGGRGVGSAENFVVLEEVAGLLGGTVGCSRAVTSLGWRPHTDQVGQTGTRIAPDVYIACGISGAIQHMVGCKSAKCIVAINKDAEAPIMSQADYVVVGDVQQVLPALRDAIKSARGG